MVENKPPIADAGLDQSVAVNTLVQLDGSGSRDPEGASLTYSWRQVEGPVDVELSDPAVVKPTFTPTVAGEYVFELVVNDGFLDSEPDSVVVVVLPLKMVLIPEGTFLMGSETGDEDEQPIHEVNLSPYYIGVYEVTNAEYKEFCDATGRPYPPNPPFYDPETFEPIDNYFLDYPNHPVVNVSWSDAVAYCEWLSEEYLGKYRLPTEAEWERAARGGLENKDYPWGDEISADKANYLDSWIFMPTEVGSYEPNAFGIYDVAGNVCEWCQDWYDAVYYKKCVEEGIVEDPPGPETGTYRVYRGGSFFDEAMFVRVSKRFSGEPDLPLDNIGFRVVMTPQ
jgi:formylglycine-generating enzyme required for sulfatase activity